MKEKFEMKVLEKRSEYYWNPVQKAVINDENFRIFLDRKTLLNPLILDKPKNIFVSMNFDIFDFSEDIYIDWLLKIYCIISSSNKHKYYIASLNIDNMYSFFTSKNLQNIVEQTFWEMFRPMTFHGEHFHDNIYLGTYVTNQSQADVNILKLLKIRNKNIFIIVHENSEFIDLKPYLKNIDFVLVRKPKRTLFNSSSVIKGDYVEQQCREFNVPMISHHI